MDNHVTGHSWRKRTGNESAPSEELPTHFKAHSARVSACRLIEEDRIIVTASHDRTIAFWDSARGEKLHQLDGHSNRVVSLAVGPTTNSDRLLSASWDKSIIHWDVTTSKQLWSASHGSIVLTCHLSQDQQLAVSGTDDGSCYLWDARTGEKVCSTTSGHSNSITCCRFSHGGTVFCSCSMDRSALVWDVRMMKRLLTLSDHTNVVSACAFSHNDHHLATASWDKTLRVYDVTSGSYRSEGATALRHHDGCVSACDFSQDDSLLVSCGYDMDVNVWTTGSYQLKNSFKGHESWIEDVCFGKRGIVSCSKDGIVRIWNTEASNAHKLLRPQNTELVLAKCDNCGKTFSVMEMQKSLQCLCVFCRLKNPSRSLEQFSIV